MISKALRIQYKPEITDARLIVSFDGWMDGGEVSTGTVRYLVERLGARRFADIDPSNFFLFNFPGSMEISALFRPRVRIEEGMIERLEQPRCAFYCSEEHNVVLFEGKEPNLRWQEYAECIFHVASLCEVNTFYFIGSVAGIVPHTRSPRFHCSVSDKALTRLFHTFDLQPSSYEGPASFVTYLMLLAQQRGIGMASIVEEIPAYVQGRNAKCIEAAVHKIKAMIGLAADVSDLTRITQDFEEGVQQLVETRPELAELIHKLENEYDKELSHEQQDEIRDWFEKQNLRLN